VRKIYARKYVAQMLINVCTSSSISGQFVVKFCTRPRSMYNNYSVDEKYKLSR